MAGGHRVNLVLLRTTAAIGVGALSLYAVVGFVWASAALCWLAWRFLCSVLPPEAETETGQTIDGGLSQEDVDGAIPAFEYRRRKEDEQCAVCISAVRGGETARRMPACGHAFHAPCIDRWLRARATCPVCRAEVRVVAAGRGVGGAGVGAQLSMQRGLRRSRNACSFRYREEEMYLN